MKETDETGPYVVDDDFQTLRQALRRMPTPEPRVGFVERALARAAAQQHATPALLPARLSRFLSRWETWAGAALGAAAAAAMAFILLRPVDSTQASRPQLALTLHETRNVDVLIDSERELKGATIRIAATGSIALDGFDDEQHIDWQADLDRGTNLLSLPVVARTAGNGELVAVIEHEGRTQRVAIALTVIDPKASRS
ncbi:MAG TPA: hypothetical protein VGQ22_16655 [Steroidobacteraceae bacterium]|jgi:hypothetical protein|nr:hypothetical protein [Steroidobacteraceae bacterium]